MENPDGFSEEAKLTYGPSASALRTPELATGKMGEVVGLEGLKERKYAQIVCYPRYSLEETEARLEEMAALGINAVEFAGKSTILNLPVLGKGYVGVVVLAHTKLGRAALKMRRTDADRAGMMHEAEMLRMANSADVGPRLIRFSENFLVMEFIEGSLLPDWVRNAETQASSRIRDIVRDLLEQCWRLDELGLDHGELSRASKQILVSPLDKVYILDFETASVKRRVSNVTSICQYLFLQSEIAEAVKGAINEVERENLIRALRMYKIYRSRERFEEILKTCRVISL